VAGFGLAFLLAWLLARVHRRAGLRRLEAIAPGMADLVQRLRE